MNQREIVGPTSCNANSTCGSLTVTSSTNAGNYTGTVSITPSPAATGTSLGINLTVNANPETVTYIHTDGLGSPVAKTNASGIRITQTKYEAYGMTVAGSDTPTIGFTGHVNDVDTGLTYMQQRYDDPVAGRFLSEDPVLTDANTGASFNRYTYALNNPYKFVDTDGRSDVCVGQGSLNCGTIIDNTGNTAASTVGQTFMPYSGAPIGALALQQIFEDAETGAKDSAKSLFKKIAGFEWDKIFEKPSIASISNKTTVDFNLLQASYSVKSDSSSVFLDSEKRQDIASPILGTQHIPSVKCLALR